ncbi:MAG: Nramp family divalent metal transporter [Candidatus Pacebacteria bacterium]|nr:Nramp family divalent metal transporter [Candidatus Paceibacterota bacterium]
MKTIKKLFFPKPETKILKGFGPAFLVIALGIGSGEFILWPYLSAHYGFGILWGALLGISIQLVIIVALERHTAFLGEDALASFSRVFKYAFSWIVFSTIIGFGWPGFSAMAAQLLSQGLSLSISQNVLSFIILILAAGLLLIGKNSYKKILTLQKINMGILLILILFLFVYYFDVKIFLDMFRGLVGVGEQYMFVPAGLSLLTFMGAIAYAGSGGNLLLMNSFYVEKEGKGLVPERGDDELIIPENSSESIENTRLFTRSSWKQNTLFFWGTGLILISMLSYVSYAVLYGSVGLPEDFTFLIREAVIFSIDIHPIIGSLFIISGSFALFGVQLGILDFIGRIAGNKPGTIDASKKQQKHYVWAITAMTLFGIIVLSLGFSKPSTLIIIGSTINAFSMGVIAFLLYRVESQILPKYIGSKLFKVLLMIAGLFYIGFFGYVVLGLF